MFGCMTGPAIGAPIAIGALNMAGAAITVPQGEPLWNKLRQCPQPVVEAARAATASKNVSFLMVHFSAAIARKVVRPCVWGGIGVLLQEGGTVGTQLYLTAFDVQTKHMIFFCHAAAARLLKSCYACAG